MGGMSKFDVDYVNEVMGNSLWPYHVEMLLHL